MWSSPNTESGRYTFNSRASRTMSRTTAIVAGMRRSTPATSQRAALIAGPVVLSRTFCTTRSIVSAACAGQSAVSTPGEG